MADLKKLDEIVDELGKQSEKLMNFTEIYTEISKLKDDIGVNVSSIKSSSEKLNEISEEEEDFNCGITHCLKLVKIVLYQMGMQE